MGSVDIEAVAGAGGGGAGAVDGAALVECGGEVCVWGGADQDRKSVV